LSFKGRNTDNLKRRRHWRGERELRLWRRAQPLNPYTVSAPAIPNLSRTVNLQYNVVGQLASKSDVGTFSYAAPDGGAQLLCQLRLRLPLQRQRNQRHERQIPQRQLHQLLVFLSGHISKNADGTVNTGLLGFNRNRSRLPWLYI